VTGPKPEPMDGIDFSPEGILGVKDAVSRLRDEALRQADWDSCVLLTHTVVYLNDYARIIRQSSEKPIKGVGGERNE
jgi:hypothetical protein